MANRDNADPSGLGNTLGWAWAWPLNRRVLYNRASADINGKPWDAKRMLIQWDGVKWTGNDIPDFNTAPPGSATGPFIMQPEGLGRLFALDKLAEGPFPEHYEPMETPLGTNPLHPNVISSPVVRIYEDDVLRLGKKDAFPYVGTTYRLTEHFHTDQARAVECHRAAGTVCGDQRNAGRCEGDWQWRLREGKQQARIHSCGCGGHASSAHAARQRSAG